MNAFPVDDETLDLIDQALDPSVTGQSSLGSLLDLLSGYDPSKLVPVLDDEGVPIPDIEEYPDPLYHPHDVIRALMVEVRRLRADV